MTGGIHHLLTPKHRLWWVRRTLRLTAACVRFLCSKRYLSEHDIINTARGPLVFGGWVMVVVFGFFGLWATFAPLKSAVVAQGTVVVDSSRKTIQHLEGGIIEAIYVHEGDKVTAGQPLIRLSDTTPRATVEMLQTQLYTLQATEARLTATRDGLEKILFPEVLTKAADNGQIKEVLDTQQRIFDTQHKALTGKIDVLNQRIAQNESEIKGLHEQDASLQKQVDLLNKEIEITQTLLAKGNSTKPHLYALQRQAADLESKHSEYTTTIARDQQSIGEAKLEMLNAKNDYLKDTVDDLKDTQSKIPDTEEKLRAAQDVLSRVVVTSPQAGIVTGLNFHTVGGVISPGAALMDIVPQDDRLVVDARVAVRDIDEVHAGLDARLRLAAYKSRRVPVIAGHVDQVSADKFVDKVTNESYYTARLTVDDSTLKHLNNVKLYPGMPVDVLIVTGERTFLSYMLSPLTDGMYRAFREQ